MKKEYSAIFFDLDGTLTDSSTGILNSVKYALAALGREIPEEEILHEFLGPSLLYSFSHFCGLNDDLTRQAIGLYRQRYEKYCTVENALYDGIANVLDRLHSAGRILAVATSKPEVYAVRVVAGFGIDRYFTAVCGAALDGSRDTKSQVIEYALERCNITDLEHTLMVGDRKYDIKGAKDAGLDSIGVLYGYGTRKELETAGADYIASNPAEIADIILNK